MTAPNSPNFIKRKLVNTAVYWAPGGNNGTGGLLYDVDPVELACRWQNKITLVRDSDGKEQVSQSEVWTEDALDGQGYLFRGTLADLDSDPSDPKQVDGASIIITNTDSPAIDNRLSLFKAFL